MKKFPLQGSYQEMDQTNRNYSWKTCLEGHGGKYVLFDEIDSDISETKESEDKNVIRKMEVSTLISSDSDLFTTKLDLENHNVLSLDVDRTRNSIKHWKTKAEKMLTLFCKSHNITYKQGLNEVVSLFLL